jgi:hypothetical protein
MLNPSEADEESDDPTILRCLHFSQSWSYAGFTVVNLYPYRSPNPQKCRAWATDNKLASVVRGVLEHNREIVTEQVRSARNVVAAWGNSPWDDFLVADTAKSILSHVPNIYCLGTTRHGSPKHPLARGKQRVPNDQQQVLWRRRKK